MANTVFSLPWRAATRFSAGIDYKTKHSELSKGRTLSVCVCVQVTFQSKRPRTIFSVCSFSILSICSSSGVETSKTAATTFPVPSVTCFSPINNVSTKATAAKKKNNTSNQNRVKPQKGSSFKCVCDSAMYMTSHKKVVDYLMRRQKCSTLVPLQSSSLLCTQSISKPSLIGEDS